MHQPQKENAIITVTNLAEITNLPRSEPSPSATKGIDIPTKPCLVHVGSIGTYASNMSARLCYSAQALGCMRMFGSWLISDSELVNVEANSRALKSIKRGYLDRIKDFLVPIKRGKNFFVPTWGHPGYGKNVIQAIEDTSYWRRDVNNIIDILKEHLETLGLKTRIALTEEGFGGTSLSQGIYFRAIARRILKGLDMYLCVGIIAKDLPTQNNVKKYLPLMLERGFHNNAMVLYANWHNPLSLTNKEIDYQVALALLTTISSSLFYRTRLSVGDIWFNLMRYSPIITVSIDRRTLPVSRKRFRNIKDSKATVSILTSMLRSVWNDPNTSLVHVNKNKNELEDEKVFEVVTIVGNVTEQELMEAEELATIPKTATTLLLGNTQLNQIYVTRLTPLITTSPEIDSLYEIKREPTDIEELNDLIPVPRKEYDKLVYEGLQDYQLFANNADINIDELIGERWQK